MIRNSVLLLCMFLSGNLSAQFVWTGRYLPLDTTVKNKFLSLKENNTFFYQDFSSGSCWISFTATGKWKAEKDTLYLYVYDNDGIVSERKFQIRHNRLNYSDITERNIIKNWGAFRHVPAMSAVQLSVFKSECFSIGIVPECKVTALVKQHHSEVIGKYHF
jgi:hypothetical protein